MDYKPGNWTFNLNSDFQSSQFADNANTVKESADGSTGRIPGFMLWGARVAYDFGPQMAISEPGVRCEKHLRPGLLHPLL